ncbi:BatD family protein [Halarcobacter sp.]|uniref:BatD family protein n=1 Tax=Halarcobacter sp. TaxID=2321133 RepID=UPI002AA92608|nr:BatD family protein [Halarcobacter sp.]
MKPIKYILFFLILSINVFASVNLKAPDSFIKGEPYYFDIEVSGSSIKFPKIEKIDNYIVESQGTSKSLQIINGDYNEKLTKRFKIVPSDDFTIPKFKFIIDDKEVYTEEKTVSLRTVNKTNSTNFDLTLIPSKDELYVGEDLVVKLIFKYKRDLQITNLGFEKPHFENFWYKRIENKNDRYEQNGYIVQELDFLLFPQKNGELTVGPLRVDAQMMQSNSSTPFGFFSSVPKVEKIYSNKLSFNVKKLPENTSLIGDFNISASVNKIDIKQGESVSLKLEISGVGNFDDIEDIKLDIPNATVYDNKPDVKTKYSDLGYEGTYTKVFSIIPESSITIPNIKLKYFDKKNKKIVEKSTQEFNIKVEKAEKKQKVILEKPKETKELTKEKVVIKENISTEEKIKYFIFGIIATLLILGLYKLVTLQGKEKVSKETPLNKLIKSSKDKNELIKVLIPYLKIDSTLDRLIFECESEKEFKILKKEILTRIKEIKL